MAKKRKLLIFSLFILIILFVNFFILISAASAAIELKLQKPFSSATETLDISSGWAIGEYVSAAYTFVSSAIAAFAIVMIIIAGVQWVLAAGNPEKISKAKNTIFKALLGLFLAMFAVFILETVSPGTVSFEKILPKELESMPCCQIDSRYEFIESESACTDKGGQIVDGSKCIPQPGLSFDPRELAGETCNGKNPRAQCYEKSCNELNKTPSDGRCDDPAKPNCCADTGTVEECESMDDCPDTHYCASAGADQQGRCFPKRENGMNCQEDIEGGGGIETLLGGGANEVCKSGRCWGWTGAGKNVCAPKDGTGNPGDVDASCTPDGGDWCADDDQCQNKNCYKPNKDADEGTCAEALPKGCVCDERNLDFGDDHDAICANSSCPDTLGTDKCP